MRGAKKTARQRAAAKRRLQRGRETGAKRRERRLTEFRINDDGNAHDHEGSTERATVKRNPQMGHQNSQQTTRAGLQFQWTSTTKRTQSGVPVGR